jgi:hypothetical protein
MEKVLLPGHDRPGLGRRFGHKTCANCLDYALLWREQLLADVASPPRRSAVQDDPRSYRWAWEMMNQLPQELGAPGLIRTGQAL